MSRFAGAGWEPNLRIIPRTPSDCRAGSPYSFDNKLNAPKKDAGFVGELRDRIGARHHSVEQRARRSQKEEAYRRTIGLVRRDRSYSPNPCNSSATDQWRVEFVWPDCIRSL